MAETDPAQARASAIEIIARLAEAGHTAYLAGGCVRDAVLGLEAKDYDIATDAHPDRVAELFRKTQHVGEAFGVVLVIRKGTRTEVATFRREWGYADGRRPDRVEFTDAESDARRRDFTVNGLFADPLETGRDVTDRDAEHRRVAPIGTVIDFVGGLADLEAGVIRAIGDPDQRFGEDYLRMLRAVRFAARFDFEVEPATLAAMKAHAPKLDRIARERVGGEVEAMLTGPHPANAAALLHDTGLDAAVFGVPCEQQSTAHLAALDDAADYPTRLRAWMGWRRPQIDEDAVRDRLCLSNEVMAAFRTHGRLGAQALRWSNLTVAEKKRTIADPLWPQALLLWRASDADPDAVAEIEADADALAADGVGISPEPLITGNNLIAMGLQPGPDFKRLLNAVYDAQLEGKVKSTKSATAWVRANA